MAKDDVLDDRLPSAARVAAKTIASILLAYPLSGAIYAIVLACANAAEETRKHQRDPAVTMKRFISSPSCAVVRYFGCDLLKVTGGGFC
jgi:hypothetical protein